MSQYRKNTGYCKLYEQKRRQGSPHKKRMLRKILNKTMRLQAARIEAEIGIRAAQVWTVVRLAIRKAELQLSYGELATHLESSAA